MPIVPLNGRFYIYIYKDGIYIDFNYYNTGHFNYTKAIRFPTEMLDEIINLLTNFETRYSNNFIIHTYRDLPTNNSAHVAEFKLLDSQKKK